jgi:hypothetical protein
MKQLLVTTFCCLGLQLGLQAQVVSYRSTLSTPESSRIVIRNSPNMLVEFLDYGVLGIGEAPSVVDPQGTPSATSGIRFKTDYSGTGRAANILLTNELFNTLVFTDNYRLRFDFYLSISPNLTIGTTGAPTQTGSTEQMLWGVGYAQPAGVVQSRATRSAGLGAWGWLTTEGGSGSTNGSDAALIFNGAVSAGRDHTTADAATLSSYFTPAFTNTGTVPHAPANKWVTAEITVAGGKVSVSYKAVGATGATFFQNVAPPTAVGTSVFAGNIMIGYEDPFTGSTSFDPSQQFMVLDNIIVEDITPPTLLVTPLVTPNSYTGGPAQPFSYEVKNNHATQNLTITGVTFGGTHGATAFSTTNTFPIVLPPSATTTLNFGFMPTAPNGVKTGEITILSDDPQAPNYAITGIQARRTVGSFLGAHYKLDETANPGATGFADSSGNNYSGNVQVRTGFDFTFGSPLTGEAAGGSIGISPADSSTTGNYFTSAVPNSPSFSVAMWIRPAAKTATRTLFQRDYDFGIPYEKICGLILDSGGVLRYRVRGAEVLNSTNFTETILNDTAYHVTLTHLDLDGFGNSTANRSRLYINGRLYAEVQNAAAVGFDDYPLAPAVASLHIGTRTSAGSGFSGALDDIQIYGAELTKEQIWQIYRKPSAMADQEWHRKAMAKVEMDGSIGVSFPSSPAGFYQLERSTDLLLWTPVEDLVSGAIDADTTMVRDTAPPQGKAFYQVRRSP